jgi:hypothetical protein
MLQRVGGAVGASVLLMIVPVTALGPPAAAKAPGPSPSTSATANPNLGPSLTGSTVCTISDPQVTEVSGLAATANGYVVINDSNAARSGERIFFLDQRCRLTRSVAYPSSAFDPEDLAVAKDGTLWVADVGDNTTLTGGSGNRRSSIALWSLAPGANSPVLHRLAYPDARARDAEALLIDGEGRPVIVTKDPSGEVYTLTQPLPANNANPAPLVRAGSFRPQATGTANPYGILGTGVVTGAAMSPDGKRAVIRTMSDAYEFTVTDGDVVAAITTGAPRITPLPSEQQGEAIAYTLDGAEFLTASDQAKATSILRYTPYEPPAPPSATPAVQAEPPAAPDRSFLDDLSLRDLRWIVIGIGVFGALMIVVGVAVIVRSRRRRRALLAGLPAVDGTGRAGLPAVSGAARTGPPAEPVGPAAAPVGPAAAPVGPAAVPVGPAAVPNAALPAPAASPSVPNEEPSALDEKPSTLGEEPSTPREDSDTPREDSDKPGEDSGAAEKASGTAEEASGRVSSGPVAARPGPVVVPAAAEDAEPGSGSPESSGPGPALVPDNASGKPPASTA